MNFNKRFQELTALFRVGKPIELDQRKVDVRFFPFESITWNNQSETELSECVKIDKVIENELFEYPVFVYGNQKKCNEVILLFHGLNERSWSKYLPWAEYLCRHTGKAILLFPIAFHLNRSPASWSDPRFLRNIMEQRRNKIGEDRSLSFANLALSERLTDNPLRFFNSGRQTYFDIIRLMDQIREGRHPLFAANTRVDIFAYSIGAFLSQILLMGNAGGHFDDSRLFMFCGGGIFNKMTGQSRSIMDKKSFDSLLQYYQHDFIAFYKHFKEEDQLTDIFFSMLSDENLKEKRTDFFKNHQQRIKGISLALDKVIPYQGVVEALGHECASRQIQLIDFPFEYTHENPFPVFRDKQAEDVNFSFQRVFHQAAEFLAN